MKNVSFFSLLPVMGTVFLLTGCVEDPPPPVETQAPAVPSATGSAITVQADMSLPLPYGLKGNPERAAVFFMQNCATCHGTSGDGEGPRAYFINPPPRNFLLASSRQKLNRPTLFEAISKGRLRTEMPAWNKVLNDQEIADLAEFVFQTFILSPQEDKEQGNDIK